MYQGSVDSELGVTFILLVFFTRRVVFCILCDQENQLLKLTQ